MKFFINLLRTLFSCLIPNDESLDSSRAFTYEERFPLRKEKSKDVTFQNSLNNSANKESATQPSSSDHSSVYKEVSKQHVGNDSDSKGNSNVKLSSNANVLRKKEGRPVYADSSLMAYFSFRISGLPHQLAYTYSGINPQIQPTEGEFLTALQL